MVDNKHVIFSAGGAGTGGRLWKAEELETDHLPHEMVVDGERGGVIECKDGVLHQQP